MSVDSSFVTQKAMAAYLSELGWSLIPSLPFRLMELSAIQAERNYHCKPKEPK